MTGVQTCALPIYGLVHASGKLLKDLGDKVDEETKASVEKEIENVKKTIEGDDTAAINAAIEELTKVSHKLAEMMYANASQEGAPGAGAGAAGAADTEQQDDDVVDADFEEVKEDDKK